MARLTAERVLDAALTLADTIGIDAFTIRKLAEALDVKPMTIYHHVPNKEAIIDGIVDRVFAEMALPSTEAGWRPAIQLCAESMRSTLAVHPWATPLLDAAGQPGPATLRHRETQLRILREGGLSVEMAGHAIALVDSYVLGFALQEAALPATSGPEISELADELVNAMDEDAYPYLKEFAVARVMKTDYNFGDEFDFGLALILDAIEALQPAPEAKSKARKQ